MTSAAALHAEGALGADPLPAALLLFTSLYGLAVFEQLGAPGGPFDEGTVRRLVGALWNGLAG